MQNDKSKLFAYGTLKYGFCAHYLIDCVFGQYICDAKTEEHYQLMIKKTNSDKDCFPCMIESNQNGSQIIGELYDIPENGFIEIDEYEGVTSGLFKRKQVKLIGGELAYTYFYIGDTIDLRLCADGIWK